MHFFTHRFIQSIAGNKKWTISNNKVPLDMFALIYQDKEMGAQFTDERSLIDLQTLYEYLPGADNRTYYLDALEDKFVVLDIEKTCPQNIKNKLLKLPFIYGEVSLSGKGYHLVFPIPTNFDEYPIAQQKVVLKETHGYYEILLQHYVTFTGNIIKPVKTDKKFEDIFADLAKEQVITNRADVSVNDQEPDIPYESDIITDISYKTYKKTPDDFYNDMSKYEYGAIAYYNFWLNRLLSNGRYKNLEYDTNQRTWLLYKIALNKLPYRPKHEQTRDNLPWLLYLSREVIAKC